MITCDKCGRTYRSAVLPLRCVCGGVQSTSIVPLEPPRWVRYVRILRVDSDAGVGDTVQRIAAKFGGEKFKAIAVKIGIPCGCSNRQSEWNRLFPYER